MWFGDDLIHSFIAYFMMPGIVLDVRDIIKKDKVPAVR